MPACAPTCSRFPRHRNDTISAPLAVKQHLRVPSLQVKVARVGADRFGHAGAGSRQEEQKCSIAPTAVCGLIGGGFPQWTPANLDKFEERHPIGTKAHLALGLVQYLGVRRSDVPLLGRQHVRDGKIVFRMYKGRRRATVPPLSLPIIPELQRIVDASAAAGITGELSFLVTEYGKPFSIAGFGNKFRQWCDEAGLYGLSAHGVRKAAATRAAENGATAHQLMAMFGWLTLKQAEHYTRLAERARLSEAGMDTMARRPAAHTEPRNKAGR
jgi:integrase-like protein